ncbi:MAG: tetraacyldisaccharide 4'-kinase [Elusimicrobiota bacterium]|nr:tetraacyldisaccharide 4'-kinase [Elusimicrobiota bacterium]
MKKLLYPFSILYCLISQANRFLTYRRKLKKPVISIGNLTWGGSGKTPIVIKTAQLLLRHGIKPAILTRGYGRKSKKPVLLQNCRAFDGSTWAEADIKDSGDEPLLISQSVEGAAVIVGAKRFANALSFQKEAVAGAYILDDGFQHWKIKRDLDIVCINAANPFGNRMLIPAGILRESLSALRRAGLIIITNSKMISAQKLAELKAEIFALCGLRAVCAHYGESEVTTLSGKPFDRMILKRKLPFILCGIGFWEGFKATVEGAGFKIKGVIKMKDHQEYTAKNLDKIYQKAEGTCVIVSKKDAVKLNSLVFGMRRKKTAVLSANIIFDDGGKRWEEAVLKTGQSF